MDIFSDTSIYLNVIIISVLYIITANNYKYTLSF